MAAGMMYIANSFKTVGRTAKARGRWPVDNDPHFWSSPPTWGICRPDLRRKAKPGQTIFFVLSKHAQHPQMVFGYMRIARIVTHARAYRLLPGKRMGAHDPNGNIIVGRTGRYNVWDEGHHRHNFLKIRQRYAIGDPAASRFLTEQQLIAKAQGFLPTLRQVLGTPAGRDGTRAIDFITRAGCHALREDQVAALRRWVDAGLPEQERGFEGAVRGLRGRPGAGRAKQASVCGPSGGVCVPAVRRGGCTPAVVARGCGPSAGAPRPARPGC